MHRSLVICSIAAVLLAAQSLAAAPPIWSDEQHYQFAAEPMPKRKHEFIRFGGKRTGYDDGHDYGHEFIRFGRSLADSANPYVDGKRKNEFIRFGKRKSEFIRFGKR